jgi:drug/metabolite transporter (DMT)-like permease
MNQLVIMACMGFAAFLGAIGQLMLRLASDKAFFPIAVLLKNWPLYIFALTYGLAVIINIWAYKVGGKIAIIYPMIALSYIFASLMAWKFFGEQVSPIVWAGTIVIVLGVAMIGYGATA